MHRDGKRVGVLLAVLGLGVGCHRESPAPAPAPSSWQTDWQDTGRYAACNVYSVPGRECGDAETFDTYPCDVATLAQVPADAVYTLVQRTEGRSPPTIQPDAFRVSAEGGQDLFHGQSPEVRRIGPGEFFLSGKRTLSSGTVVRDTLVGCHAEGSRLYGCYSSCRNGKYSSYGSFMAERWSRRAGEAEASGLRLASESFVAQGLPVDVHVTHGHAYVASVYTGNNKGGLTVFDVSNPAAPVLRSTLSLPTDNYWNSVASRGDALYVGSASSGLIVLDISQPASPRIVHQLPEGQGRVDVHTLFVDGERLYAMSPDPQPRTLIFDIHEPLAPVLLGQYVEPTAEGVIPGFPHDAFVLEGRLYINHWSNGYLIVDVTDPAAPRKLGGFGYPYATSHASAVGHFGERLIAFEGGEDWGAHLRVLDVTDPARPTQVGEYVLDEGVSIHNLVLVGSRLYVAHYQNGVRVLDVSVPEHPVEQAYFNTWRPTDPGRGSSFYDGAIGLRVPGDGFVYVVDTSRGLLVFPEP